MQSKYKQVNFRPAKGTAIIYGIKLEGSNKTYIGQTRNSLTGRIEEHLKKLRAGKHFIPEMQEDFKKCNKYTVFILDVVDLKTRKATDAEKDCILKYETYLPDKGYNHMDRRFR